MAINHILFADDSIIFGDATVEGVEVILSIISEYEKASEEKVNYEKSTFFGVNVKDDVKKLEGDKLRMRIPTNPKKYLGHPMMVGKKKKWAFSNYADKYRAKIENWGTCFLSPGGKEVLIKSILQSLPIYAMQVFLFPKSFTLELENILNRFLWRNLNTQKGIH